MRGLLVTSTALWLIAFPAVPGAAGEPAASPEEVTPLPVGAELPELTLTTADGEPFDLKAAVAGKPTVLVLYRGGW